MKDPVRFEHPTRLRLDDIDRLASRSRVGPIAQCRPTQLICVSGVSRIEKRVGILDFDGLGNSGHGERNRNLLREL